MMKGSRKSEVDGAAFIEQKYQLVVACLSLSRIPHSNNVTGTKRR